MSPRGPQLLLPPPSRSSSMTVPGGLSARTSPWIVLAAVPSTPKFSSPPPAPSFILPPSSSALAPSPLTEDISSSTSLVVLPSTTLPSPLPSASSAATTSKTFHPDMANGGVEPHSRRKKRAGGDEQWQWEDGKRREERACTSARGESLRSYLLLGTFAAMAPIS
jgi:hypothetical protein